MYYIIFVVIIAMLIECVYMDVCINVILLLSFGCMCMYVCIHALVWELLLNVCLYSIINYSVIITLRNGLVVNSDVFVHGTTLTHTVNIYDNTWGQSLYSK